MECTLDPCHHPLVQLDGEHWGCGNTHCDPTTERRTHGRGYCTRVELNYNPSVRKRSGWYYLSHYWLPFSWISMRSNSRYFALEGSVETGITRLLAIEPLAHRELYTVPYQALPSNQDFKREWYLLRDRVMNECLGGVRTAPTNSTVAYNRLMAYLDEWCELVTLPSVDDLMSIVNPTFPSQPLTAEQLEQRQREEWADKYQ